MCIREKLWGDGVYVAREAGEEQLTGEAKHGGQVGQCRQFPVDGPVPCLLPLAGLLVPLYIKGCDFFQRLVLEERGQVNVQPLIFLGNVLPPSWPSDPANPREGNWSSEFP